MLDPAVGDWLTVALADGLGVTERDGDSDRLGLGVGVDDCDALTVTENAEVTVIVGVIEAVTVIVVVILAFHERRMTAYRRARGSVSGRNRPKSVDIHETDATRLAA